MNFLSLPLMIKKWAPSGKASLGSLLLIFLGFIQVSFMDTYWSPLLFHNFIGDMQRTSGTWLLSSRDVGRLLLRASIPSI